MTHVALLNRKEDTGITVLADARIRAVGTAREFGIADRDTLFVEVDHGGVLNYYAAGSFRMLEVKRG